LSFGSDLLGDFIVQQKWGSLDSLKGNHFQTVVTDPQEVSDIVKNVFATRKRNGYEILKKAERELSLSVA
jgi:hypothetical protein